MFLQLWSSAPTRVHRAARHRGDQKRAYRPGMDWLDERCLLSAHLVAPFDQGVRAPESVVGPPAVVTLTNPSPQPAPSGSVAKAANPPLSHNPGASSSATNHASPSTSSSLASSPAPTVSITDVSPNLFATPLATTPPPATSVSPTAQSAVLPDKRFERVLDIVVYGLLTTLSEAGSRPESAPAEPDSSPDFWAVLKAAALFPGALPQAITVPKGPVWQRVERRERSKLPNF